MSLLEVQHVDKYFLSPKKFQALTDVNFSVERSEFVCITGKSGSGKSTLLYLLSTMDTDFKGSIRINKEELKGKSNRWLAEFRNSYIGFVFQFHYLLPEFTSLQNVILPGQKLGKLSKEELENKAMNLLDLLDVKGQAQKRTNLLSGGQQQRVAIARALINDPLIVMGDEPTGNLDSKNTAIVFELFKKLAEEKGQTLLVVTHDEEYAAKSDKQIHLVDGKVME